MINAIAGTQVSYNQDKQKTAGKTAKTAVVKNTNTADKYISKDPKVNIKNSLKNGSLVYTEPTKLLFGLVTIRDAFYTYIPQKNETIADIKQKFGIKDGVISGMNDGINDDDFCPADNNIYEIYFRLD